MNKMTKKIVFMDEINFGENAINTANKNINILLEKIKDNKTGVLIKKKHEKSKIGKEISNLLHPKKSLYTNCSQKTEDYEKNNCFAYALSFFEKNIDTIICISDTNNIWNHLRFWTGHAEANSHFGEVEDGEPIICVSPVNDWSRFQMSHKNKLTIIPN